MSWLLLEGAIAAAALYVIYVCFYRLYLHPLAKYPGPVLCALTDWYPAYFEWKGEWVETQSAWREKYGDVVRHGPNSLTFFGLSAMGQIYGVRSNVSKSAGYATLSVSRTPNLISARDKSIHGFKRRVISQTMTEESLKSMEPRIVSHIKNFVALLGQDASDGPFKGWTSPQSFRTKSDWLTLDIMSDLTYGKPLGLLSSEEPRWVPSVLRKLTQVIAAVTLSLPDIASKTWSLTRILYQSLIQPNLFHYKVDRLLLASRRREFRRMGIWLSKLATARATVGSDEKQEDMFDAMMNAVDPKTNKSFTQKDMWTESVLLLFSGSDTTSSTMSAVLSYLLHNPEWLTRVTDEVRSTFSSEDEILLGAALSSCEVLIACIDESQRLTPTAPNGPPRVVDAGGITIDGHFLQEGTVVNSPIYHMQREEAYFDMPNAFRPNRWMIQEGTEAEDEQRIQHQRKAYMPFHIGPRSCTGWRLARMELEITLARILFLYDIKLAPESPCCANKGAGESCEVKMKSWMVATVDGPLMQFKPREMVVACLNQPFMTKCCLVATIAMPETRALSATSSMPDDEIIHTSVGNRDQDDEMIYTSVGNQDQDDDDVLLNTNHHPYFKYTCSDPNHSIHTAPKLRLALRIDMDAITDAQKALTVNFEIPVENPAASLQGKTLLVTGGASGFGEAIVTAFTRNPNTAAIIADYNDLRGLELERTLREAGCNVKFIKVDVTDWRSVTGLFRSALIWLRDSFGQEKWIDHVVTSAGVAGEALDITPVHPDDFIEGKIEFEAPTSRSVNISVIGTLYTATAAMKFALGLHKDDSIAKRGDKSLTMLSSLAGYTGMALQSDYGASKWGVRGLFRSLLDDAQATSCPVRVNLIAPYFVATPLTQAFVPYMQELGIKLADLRDVEAAALRLICDSSVHGRAVGVWQGGPRDLGDDLGGGFGSVAIAEGIKSGALRMSGTFITQKREVS
ncbi:hypothetical protein Q7P37_004884 [Cladosporium fusiforme]